MATPDDRPLTGSAGRIKMLAHRRDWIADARPNQLPPTDRDWDVWLYLAGRGNGKTRLAGEHIAWETWQHPDTITHVVAATHGDLRSVCYEGQSGLLQIIPPECISVNGYNRSLGEIYLTNGSIIRGFSAEAPDRARGPQCHRLWGDELAAWDLVRGGAQAMFDQAMFGLRLGDWSYAIFTTTPKPIQLIRNLVDLSNSKITDNNRRLSELRVRVTRGRTAENFNNLSKNFRILISQYEGTRLGRQELDAEILEDVQGALWKQELLDRNRRDPRQLPELVRVVVAIDPAASNNEGSDETGIMVGGIDEDGTGWLVEDASGRYSPNEWGRRAIGLFHKWEADIIIGEANNGGEMVGNTIFSIDPNIPFKAVRASRGKIARAEPVSSLCEQDRIRHVGEFRHLEDQLTALTLSFDKTKAGYSPDRADAYVWLWTELILGDQDGQGIYEYYRTLNTQTVIKAEGSRKTLRMRPQSPSYPQMYGRDGKKYDMGRDGTINIPESELGVFLQNGFVVVE
jgi:phage terminase large subunit-like protein